MNLVQAIKRCAQDAAEAAVPCDVMFGKVLSVEPWRIGVGEMELEGDILAVSKELVERTETITIEGHTRSIVVNEGAGVGDTVTVLRQSGGGGYLAFAVLEE
ncbi:MAG: DUF2577 domain-containing protein [Clostridia bacterium]|nr:DUF2577 domain-containing protein [Clostridia bacterium]